MSLVSDVGGLIPVAVGVGVVGSVIGKQSKRWKKGLNTARGKGWKGESTRHSMARMGIKTGTKVKNFNVTVDGKLIQTIPSVSRLKAKSHIPYDSWLHGVNYKITPEKSSKRKRISRFTFEEIPEGYKHREIFSHRGIPEGARRLDGTYNTKYHVWKKDNNFYFWEKDPSTKSIYD